ncbi:hypothetical protein M8494_34610 (plasmid) [Serratia ureilytica]
MIKPIAVALVLLTPSAYADVDLPAELKDKLKPLVSTRLCREISGKWYLLSLFQKKGRLRRLTVNTSLPIYSK